MFQLYWICLPSHPSLPLVCMFVFVVSFWHLKSCRWPKLPRDPACYQSCGHGEEPATLPVEGAEAEVQPEALRLQQVLIKPRKTAAVHRRQSEGGLLTLVNQI